ncbi:MAG: methylmalonyl Co-A mutase-associated GTPase MeaB [Candidatus Acetothermia bacterium]|nr:methylmalonyl Co-A mutase-associated GTPase MeaB [Candidatus Acetothermia bacterium]MDH7504782.1 methylmalonyl Co-A mutase-associated GTPase MeaB [Candidatus Acetothermia bacterium]
MKELVQGLLRGEERALARAISLVEDRDPRAKELIERAFPHTGGAYRLGITGPPGVGKSTIVDRLVPLLQESHGRTAILACDPSSPFSEGALLGDRIRMRGIDQREGVFIRSMATRGALGGLARATHEAAFLLEAAGFELIIFETIGVGQAEVEIVEAADTVVVVLTPQSGDAIQAMKAGLMEIADILVVNKSDQGGADAALQNLESALSLSSRDWRPPVIRAAAEDGEGIPELAKALARHRQYLEGGPLLERRRGRLRAFLKRIIAEELERQLWDERGLEALNGKVEALLERRAGPHQVAEEILREIGR